MPLISPTGKRKTLAPIRPNAGLQAWYQSRLDQMIAAMQRSVMRHISAAYRRKPPEMAEDASPAVELQETVDRLAREWGDKFDDFAQSAAKKFGRDAVAAADRSFSAALRKAGFTVKFQMTREANDIMQATIATQIELIKSIPAEYMTQVQGAVMRSVQAGRDVGTLAKEIEHQFGVTKRRAAFIALDQNNKATASITRVRQQQLGITKAVWLHSAGGKEPRESHVAFSQGRNGGPVYEIAKGAYLDGVWTWPGVEPRCRCVSRSVIEGIND